VDLQNLHLSPNIFTVVNIGWDKTTDAHNRHTGDDTQWVWSENRKELWVNHFRGIIKEWGLILQRLYYKILQ